LQRKYSCIDLKAILLLVPVKRLFLPAIAILLLIALIPKFINISGEQAKPIEWLKMPGLAVDIDISMDGTAWIAAPDGHVKTWDGRQWQDLGGDAMRIAAGPGGNSWIISPDNRIFRRADKRWIEMPGRATDIAVGASGAVWMIGTDRQAGGFGVFKWGETDWVAEDMAALRIAVGPKGNPWVVNDQNQIYRLTQMAWKQAPEAATDIAIAANGVSWIIGPPGSPDGDGPVSAWGGKGWVRHDGALAGIATDARSYPWGVNGRNEIFADSRSAALKR